MRSSVNRRSALRWIWLSLIVIVLDQWTKHLVLKHFGLLSSKIILPFFNFTLDFNRGAAFSFLSSAGGWQRWFFIVVTVLICLFILIWLGRLSRSQHWKALALALIFGGALSNLSDRVSYGYVIDFLDFHIHQYHWPIFNLADTAISIGVIVLAIDLLFVTIHRSNRNTENVP